MPFVTARCHGSDRRRRGGRRGERQGVRRRLRRRSTTSDHDRDEKGASHEDGGYGKSRRRFRRDRCRRTSRRRADAPVRELAKHVGEARAPDDVRRACSARARVHGLERRVVGADDASRRARPLRRSHDSRRRAEERARLVDRVHHRPRARERRRAVARERQVDEAVERHAFVRLLGADDATRGRAASKMVLARSLPTRNVSVGTPFIGEIAALSEKTSCPRRLREAREDDARSRAP